MTTIQDTITKIRQAREKLIEAIRLEEFATRPILQDLSVIPALYDIFAEKAGNEAKTTNGRDIFTFIVIYLYAPRKFFGGKMPKGLRPAIGRVTGTKAVTVLSRSSAELLILYQNYSDFREKVNSIMKDIMNWLGIDSHENLQQ